MKTSNPGLLPDQFDARFSRTFGLLAFTVNRHIINHMRRIGSELDMDFESAMIWGALAHMNVLPSIPLDADPLKTLNQSGYAHADFKIHPVKLSEVSMVTSLPRETVRRKLELLKADGKADRTEDGRWVYLSTGISEREREFTKQTVLQFLRTTEQLLSILSKGLG